MSNLKKSLDEYFREGFRNILRDKKSGKISDTDIEMIVELSIPFRILLYRQHKHIQLSAALFQFLLGFFLVLAIFQSNKVL